MTRTLARTILQELLAQHEQNRPAHMDKDNAATMSHPIINSYWLDKKQALEMGIESLNYLPVRRKRHV